MKKEIGVLFTLFILLTLVSISVYNLFHGSDIFVIKNIY